MIRIFPWEVNRITSLMSIIIHRLVTMIVKHLQYVPIVLVQVSECSKTYIQSVDDMITSGKSGE